MLFIAKMNVACKYSNKLKIIYVPRYKQKRTKIESEKMESRMQKHSK